MSLLTELFGDGIVDLELARVKELIRELPPTQAERRSYLLHDWAAIKGVVLTEQDFIEVIGYNERK
jgi:hypothetical protein